MKTWRLKRSIISKFHHMAAELKLLNHNGLLITVTITINLYNFDRHSVFMLIPDNNVHNHANLLV